MVWSVGMPRHAGGTSWVVALADEDGKERLLIRFASPELADIEANTLRNIIAYAQDIAVVGD